MSDHKKIAKNTLFLYGRMVCSTLIGLFTTRIVLQALGVTDYGVYNVVGGVVGMLGFFNFSMLTSTQRFLNVGMAENDPAVMRRIFSTAINIHVLIGLVVVALLETVGLWFLNTQLTIPPGQMRAAQWVFQCSIVSFFINILASPYNAALVANEKMGVFAVLSILRSVLNLSLALCLFLFKEERLIVYGAFQMGLELGMRFIYSMYCRKKLPECRYKWVWEKGLLKNMTGFSGWMFFGCISDMLSQQGVNMLINIFFGPIYNAARGVAMTVYNTISQFSENFLVSINPQIVTSYARKDYDESFSLAFLASRLSFYLMMIVGIPIFINAAPVLKIWLSTVPPLTPLFVQLIIIEYTIRSSYNSLAKLNQAYGKIKVYQLTISSLFVLTFAGTYLLYKFDFPVYYTFLLSIGIAVIGLFARLIVLRTQQNFPVLEFMKKVLLRLVIVCAVSFTVSYLASGLFAEDTVGAIVSCIVDFLICVGCVWLIGLNSTEKAMVTKTVLSKLSRFSKTPKMI